MKNLKPEQLIFAAHARCRCGAGLAYIDKLPLTDDWGRAWYCSAVLLGDEQKYEKVMEGNMFKPPIVKGEDGIQHDGAYDFAFFEIKSELQASQGGATTRTKGKMACAHCGEYCYQCKCSKMPEIKLVD